MEDAAQDPLWKKYFDEGTYTVNNTSHIDQKMALMLLRTTIDSACVYLIVII